MPAILDSVLSELLSRQVSEGAWAFRAQARSPALEPTCLALLALASCADSLSPEPFLRMQLPGGSWGSVAGDEEGSGLTGLAVITLNRLGFAGVPVECAISWLVRTAGREARWPWKWKFLITDTKVRFNPGKFGWPWQPLTCSWVIPTAFAVLALKQTRPICDNAKRRIRLGIEMLLDRSCPGGGWNAGNGIACGRPLSAHIDATAAALLALQREPPNHIIDASLQWMQNEARACTAIWSVAWATLALEIYDHPVGVLQQHLVSNTQPECVRDNATLAITALALKCGDGNNPFKVRQ